MRKTACAVLNNEQPPQPAKMSVKDQNEFGENMEKCVAATEKNNAKKLIKRYACAFATNNKRQGRTGMVKYKIDTGEGRPIKQASKSIPLAKRKE